MTIAMMKEEHVEKACLSWLESLGWRTAHGPDISRDGPFAERGSYEDVVLEGRLRELPSTGSIPICPPKRWTTPCAS